MRVTRNFQVTVTFVNEAHFNVCPFDNVSCLVYNPIHHSYVNFRDRYYYSVLLNTFNICVDATNIGQNNSENICTNNTLQEGNSNVTRTPSASFSSENRGVNSQRIHELQEVSAFYWCSLAVGYTAADQGHPTDRFGKLSVRKALNLLQFSKGNFHHELSWYRKFKAKCFRIDQNVVSGTEKRSAKIFGKEIRPINVRFSGNGQKCPTNFEKTQVPLEWPNR